MKKTWLLAILCMVLSLVSCNKRDDNIITYTSDEIYLNCEECGYISRFPKKLLIFESEEQLERALNEYEDIASLMDLDTVAEEYPIGEYIYLLQYFETDIDSKVECKGLNVNKEDMWICFEHKIKSPKEGPAAITAYVTYAALPKEHLVDCDFSNQQGVLYLGRNEDIENPVNENQGNETVEPPRILNFESFEKLAELKGMLEEYEYILSTYSNGRHSDTLRFVCYIGASDEKETANPADGAEAVVNFLRIGDEKVTLYKVEETVRNEIEGHIVTATLLELIENGDSKEKGVSE